MGVHSISLCLIWQIVGTISVLDAKVPITHLFGVSTPLPPQLDIIVANAPVLPFGSISRGAKNMNEFSSPLIVTSSTRTLPVPKITQKHCADTEKPVMFEKFGNCEEKYSEVTCNPYPVPAQYNMNLLDNVEIPQIRSLDLIPYSIQSTMTLPVTLSECVYPLDPVLCQLTYHKDFPEPDIYITETAQTIYQTPQPFYAGVYTPILTEPCKTNEQKYSEQITNNKIAHQDRPLNVFSDTVSIPKSDLPLVKKSPENTCVKPKSNFRIAKRFDYTSKSPNLEPKVNNNVVNCGKLKKSPPFNPKEYVKAICDSLNMKLNRIGNVSIPKSDTPINIADKISRSIESLDLPSVTPIIIGETFMPTRDSIILQKSEPTITYVSSSPQSSGSEANCNIICSSIDTLLSKISSVVNTSYSSYIKALSKISSKLPYLPPVEPFIAPKLIKSNTASTNFSPVYFINPLPIIQTKKPLLCLTKLTNLGCPSFTIPGQILAAPISLKQYCSKHLSPNYLPPPRVPSCYTNSSSKKKLESLDVSKDVKPFSDLILLSDLFDDDKNVDMDSFKSILKSI